ncbi:hypothetical protein [Flavobacterium sp.]|uniref:hypothetical protein n=1 Tax=Flavobacterium sp. TaxID=239 RepID=UPI00374FF9C9
MKNYLKKILSFFYAISMLFTSNHIEDSNALKKKQYLKKVDICEFTKTVKTNNQIDLFEVGLKQSIDYY